MLLLLRKFTTFNRNTLKLVAVALAGLLLAGCLEGCEEKTSLSNAPQATNPPENTTQSLSGWKQVRENNRWSERSHHGVVVFKDKLWLLGGGYEHLGLNDVWVSEDGVEWKEMTNTKPWVGAENTVSVVFKDKIWILGGGSFGTRDDVWSSADGLNWKLEAKPGPATARVSHQAVAFKDRLWVIGGMTNKSWGFDTTSQRAGDVWSSADGRVWRQETAKAPWTARHGHRAVAFKDRLWILGGYVGSRAYTNDVWSRRGRGELATGECGRRLVYSEW